MSSSERLRDKAVLDNAGAAVVVAAVAIWPHMHTMHSTHQAATLALRGKDTIDNSEAV